MLARVTPAAGRSEKDFGEHPPRHCDLSHLEGM
jgi:hypothetical protein